MNHEEAIRNRTAAGYLLGQLTEAENDAFEEHYFDCPVCGDTIRSGVAMFANGREVVQMEPAYRRFRPLKWVSTGAAAAALTMVVGYQALVIPRIQQMASMPTIAAVRPTELPMEDSRGSTNAPQVIGFIDHEPLILYREIPLESPFPLYQFELCAASGKVLGVTDVGEEWARKGDPIPLSVHPLPAGRYVLKVLGVRKEGNRTELNSWSIVVK
jgi:hypothetical protein